MREKTIELGEATARKFALNIMQLLSAKWFCFDRSGQDSDDPEKQARLDATPYCPRYRSCGVYTTAHCCLLTLQLQTVLALAITICPLLHVLTLPGAR